jgi:YVTN family beta-propeller protein
VWGLSGGTIGAGFTGLVEFRILGPLEVVADGRPVVVGAPKLRALLAVLLLHRGEVISTDRLIDALWGERASPTAAKTVQVYVSNLRKTLGNGLLVTQARGYMLQAEPGQLDVDLFEALVEQGRQALEQGDALTAATVLRKALGVWRGPALADFAYEPFAQAEIARLEEARLAALEDRIDADLAVGEHARIVGELEALVREHPLRERVRGQLMLALYRSGRQADALQAYQQARRELLDGLGLEPGHALQELERAILAHDPGLDLPSRHTPRPSPAAARNRLRGALIAAGGALLLAAIAAVAVKLAGSGASAVRVAPNSVAAIDIRSGRVVAAAPVGVRPGLIAFGAGSLWIANLDDQTISRVDPGSLRTLRNIQLSAPPMGLAASADGAWVVEPNANPSQSSVSVIRIDAEFDVPGAPVQIGNVVPNAPGAVAVQGGSVWVAPSNGVLTRLDARTGSVQGHVDPNATASGVAVGEGAVWLTDTDAGNVIRVDPTGLVKPIPVGNGPTAIAAGEGGVWVVDSLNETVVRIDPETWSVTAVIPVGRSPAGVAVGGGSVWVANSGDGTVTRINPGTDKPATIRIGGRPQALTVAAGRVWVTVDERSIAPSPAGSTGETLRMVSFNDVVSMDPALAASGLSWQLLHATCAGLVNYPDKAGPAGSQLEPEVAQALPTRSPDGRTYTFTIHRGFRFSPPSNQLVTAQTFKDSIERTLNPAMHSYSASYGYLADVVGARRYMAGKASHITGIVARGDTLTIRLAAPAGDFLSQLALPGFCAVPSGTPAKPNLGRVPSAGPYYVTSYTPGQGVVLARNPNYHGDRPHRFAHIELMVRVPAAGAVHEIESGTADYTQLGADYYGFTPAIRGLVAQLTARYGARTAALARGPQQYFVNPAPELHYLALNTHRPLFSDPRLRQAVNYAIDRSKLAELGFADQPLPGPTTDHYLPPGMPGYRTAQAYPPRPDLAKARQLVQAAHARGRTAVLYTGAETVQPELAQIVKNNLGAIGIQVQIKTFPVTNFFQHLATPGEPFDLAITGWAADYPDPSQMLNTLLDGSAGIPAFNDPAYQRRLATAARASGPQRYLTYGALDLDLARNAAPLAAFGNRSSNDFFSRRIGCQTYNGIYGMDLAALCIRGAHRQ